TTPGAGGNRRRDRGVLREAGRRGRRAALFENEAVSIGCASNHGRDGPAFSFLSVPGSCAEDAGTNEASRRPDVRQNSRNHSHGATTRSFGFVRKTVGGARTRTQ